MFSCDDDHDDLWVPLAEAARRLGIPGSALRRWISDGNLNAAYSLTTKEDDHQLVNCEGIERLISDNKTEAYLTISEAVKVVPIPRSTLLSWIERRLIRARILRGHARVTVLDLREAYHRQRVHQIRISDYSGWLAVAIEALVLLLGFGIPRHIVLFILLANVAWLGILNLKGIRVWLLTLNRRAKAMLAGSGTLTMTILTWFTWLRLKHGTRIAGQSQPGDPPSFAATAAGPMPLGVTIVIIPVQWVFVILIGLGAFSIGPLGRKDGNLPRSTEARSTQSTPVASGSAASAIVALPSVTSTPHLVAASAASPPPSPPLTQLLVPPSSTSDAGLSTTDEAVCQPSPQSLSRSPVFDFPQDGQDLDLEGSYNFQVTPVQGAEGYSWQFEQNARTVWDNLVDEGDAGESSYSVSEDSAAHSRFGPGAVKVTVRASICGSWSAQATITINLVPRPLGQVDSNPATEECQVDPRSLESLMELDYTEQPDPQDSSVLVEGSPADNVTVEAVTATLRELTACLNAGDWLRAYALFSDSGVRSTFFPEGPPTQEDLQSLSLPPTPTIADDQIAMPSIEDILFLPDGRVSARVVGIDPGATGNDSWVFIMVESGDRWRIVEQIEVSPDPEPHS